MKKAPATTAKRLNSPRQYRALRELLKGPRTVREILDAAGGNGAPQLIGALKKKGLAIATIWHRGQDRDKRPTRYGTYNLCPESTELANQLIEAYSGISRHGENERSL